MTAFASSNAGASHNSQRKRVRAPLRTATPVHLEDVLHGLAYHPGKDRVGRVNPTRDRIDESDPQRCLIEDEFEPGLASPQFLLHLPVIRDVGLDRHVVGHDAQRVLDRRNLNVFPIVLTVLSTVDDFAFPWQAAAQAAPHFIVSLAGCQPGLENLRVLSNGLGGAVASHFGETGVDVLNAGVQISDNHGGGALLYRDGELPQLVLRAFALGDIDKTPKRFSNGKVQSASAQISPDMNPILSHKLDF